MRRSGDDEESKRIAMDLDTLLKCAHFEHVVQCYGYIIKDTEVLIFMELMASCFEKLLKRTKAPIPEPIVGKIAVAVVKALNFLKEDHGIMHRDVKPSNILINEKGVVKLCDFGISGHLIDSKAKTRQAGCAAYMAPERIEISENYDVRADVWSMGITLVELAMGKFPYPQCNTDFEVMSKILSEPPPSLSRDTFSADFCSFVAACLTKDCKKRPKYKKLLEHPFIKLYSEQEVDVAAWFKDVSDPKT
jgi:mitogen-activated protein kinase kinase 7